MVNVTVIVEIWSIERWIDPATGSVKRQTRGPFGIEFGPVVTPSQLEAWLAEREGFPRQEWRHYGSELKNVWGVAIGTRCGSAPPIYQLRHAMPDFIRRSSDEELLHFVETMRSGGEAEQEAAVEAATKKILNEWEGSSSD